jgi:hypothetical protein
MIRQRPLPHAATVTFALATGLCFLFLEGALAWGSEAAREGARDLCDPRDPAHDCPGSYCLCCEEVFELVFADSATNTLDLAQRDVGRVLSASVILDTKSDAVSAWSYGLDHDDAFLSILGASFEGTEAEVAVSSGFAHLDWNTVESCREDPDPLCRNPRPATGLVSAVVLAFTQIIVLEPQRNELLRVEYAVETMPQSEGTRVEFVEYLRTRGGYENDIMLTLRGASRQPMQVIDGILRSSPSSSSAFRRGDYDANGRVELTDALGLLGFLFLGNMAPPTPGPFECGDDPTEEGTELGCERACR